MRNALWYPSEERRKNANMTHYMNFLKEKYKLVFKTYDELYSWSTTKRDEFWSTLWDFFNIKASTPYKIVLENPDSMLESKWFQGARLNSAGHLLQFRDDSTALVFKGEAQEPVAMTYKNLFEQVASLSASLRECGITTNDRVVGFMPNMIETVVAMLATTSIGAIWSSCSPDFGIKGVLDRFGQIEPKILFTANGYSYRGKKIDSLSRISGILKELPTVEKVVVVPYTEEPETTNVPNSIHYKDFLSRHVPQKIVAVADIPYTISGKKVEIAVRKIIEGKPVYNRDALANPEALDLYKDVMELQY